MTKLGILVGEKNWNHFGNIFKYLTSQYETTIFEPKVYQFPVLNNRINHWEFKHNLNQILRRNDICFFEWASDLLMVASQMPKHCPIVTRLHSFELFEWAPKINWQIVDKIILVSQAMQRKFCTIYPDQANKTVVVHNGISLERFKPSPSQEYQFRIGMLCHIIPLKRVYEMVLNLYEIKKIGLKFKLYVAGKTDVDKRYMASINRLVKELNLQDSVIFEGYVADTPAWFHKIDIFISNSFWEGQQVALLEALASGCYCLSHFWDGADEMLPLDNLFITSGELIEKIRLYSNLSDSEKQKRQKSMQAIACEKFDIQFTLIQINKIIESLAIIPQ